MRAKLLIAQQNYSLRVISNCRYCTSCGKLDGLITTSREQILWLVKLAISYSFNKIEYINSTLLSLVTQSLAQESIIILSKIVLVYSVVARIEILYLNPISIQAYTSKK